MLRKAATCLLLTGCADFDLSGEWSGDLDCGPDDEYAVAFDLESTGTQSWTGTGTGDLECVIDNGVLADTIEPCTLNYDLEVTTASADGAFWVDMFMLDCTAIWNGNEYPDRECFGIWDIQYDGTDTLDGQWDICGFEATR